MIHTIILNWILQASKTKDMEYQIPSKFNWLPVFTAWSQGKCFDNQLLSNEIDMYIKHSRIFSEKKICC